MRGRGSAQHEGDQEGNRYRCYKCVHVSVFVSVCVCVSLSLSQCLYVFICVSLSLSLPLCLSIVLLHCVTVSLCHCVTVSLCLFISLSFCLCVSLLQTRTIGIPCIVLYTLALAIPLGQHSLPPCSQRPGPVPAPCRRALSGAGSYRPLQTRR